VAELTGHSDPATMPPSIHPQARADTFGHRSTAVQSRLGAIDARHHIAGVGGRQDLDRPDVDGQIRACTLVNICAGHGLYHAVQCGYCNSVK